MTNAIAIILIVGFVLIAAWTFPPFAGWRHIRRANKRRNEELNKPKVFSYRIEEKDEVYTSYLLLNGEKWQDAMGTMWSTEPKKFKNASTSLDGAIHLGIKMKEDAEKHYAGPTVIVADSNDLK